MESKESIPPPLIWIILRDILHQVKAGENVPTKTLRWIDQNIDKAYQKNELSSAQFTLGLRVIRFLWMNQFEEAIKSIKQWRPNKPVSKLLEAIDAAEGLLGEVNLTVDDLHDLVDFYSLPTSKIWAKEIVRSECVLWTIDDFGNCLVGIDMDKIKNIQEI